jgi:hypothetical protein
MIKFNDYANKFNVGCAIWNESENGVSSCRLRVCLLVFYVAWLFKGRVYKGHDKK